MEKFIMAAGTAVRISDTGSGDRTIVLLHGYLESLDIWDGFTKLLSPHARVVAIDLPGHGISEVKGEVHTMAFLADVVYGALESLKIGKALVVGHSMGGYVALEFIRRHPDAAAGIVLFHSTPDPDSEQKKVDRQREINLILGGKKELLAKTFPGAGFAPLNRIRFKDEIEDLAEQIILTEDEGIVAILRGMCAREDLNGVLRESKVPQMAILGRYDEYITPDLAAKMIEAQPQMRVCWLEESGHMGFIEEAGKSAEAILGFLDDVW